MSAGSETTSAATIAGIVGYIGALSGDEWFTITIPTIIGAVVHVYNRKQAGELERGDIVIAGVVSAAVGFWGGPWVADMAPSSEKALPFMCFLSALFATNIIKGAADWLTEKLEGLNARED